MAETKLGKVGLTPKGEWSSSASYEQLDLVSYDGGSWVAKKPSTGVTPIDGEYWMSVAEKGDTGEQGVPGNVSDVQLNGSSIVVDGVATIPVYKERGSATYTGIYPIRTNDGNTGVTLTSRALGINPATEERMTNRTGNLAIVSANYDSAVKHALVDSAGATYTLSEQKAAQDRLGIDPAYELIEDYTATEDFTAFYRSKEPDGTAYNFRKMFIVMKTALTSSETAGGRIGIDHVNDIVYLCQTNNSASAVFATGWAELEIRNGVLRSRHSTGTFSYSSIIYESANVLNGNDLAIGKYGDTIKSVQVRHYNSRTLAAGSVFKIYGIRA